MSDDKRHHTRRGLALAVLAAAGVVAAGLALALALQQRERMVAPLQRLAQGPGAAGAGASQPHAHRPAAGPPGNPARGAVAAAGAATAASAAAATPAFVAFGGDPVAGQRVAMGQGGAGVAGACFRCHGLHGAGDAGGGFPRLAAQPAFYLYKQLVNYADGTRPNEVMTPIALRMTDQERQDVAAYYAASQAGNRPPPGRVDVQLLQRGATIAAVGSQSSGVQSCVSCHGPNGAGMPPDGPALAGQDAAYLQLQLQLWQQGRRTNDAYGVMADVARRLTAEEREAVALYFSTLPPP